MDRLDPAASAEDLLKQRQFSTSPEPSAAADDRRHLFGTATTTAAAASSSATAPTSNNSMNDSYHQTSTTAHDARDPSLNSAVAAALQKDVPITAEDSLRVVVEEKQTVGMDGSSSSSSNKQEQGTAPPVAPRAKKRTPKPRPSSSVTDDSRESLAEKLKRSTSMQRNSMCASLVHDDGKDAKLSESLPITTKPPFPPVSLQSVSTLPSSSSSSSTSSSSSGAVAMAALASASPTSASYPSLQSSISNHPKRLSSRSCREMWTPKSFQPTISEVEDTMSLPVLVEEQSRTFPLSVTVVRGLENQIFPKSAMNIHFLKQTKVVDISDSLNQRYLIPFNSPVKFGVLYCPGVKTESYFFERVLDIINASDLPKVVTCTKKYKGKNEDCSVGVNEILIVQEVISQHAKSHKKSKLRVFSFTHQKEKILHGDILGKFTTDPNLAGLHIPDILKHFADSFPLCARLYPEEGTESSFPKSLAKDPLLLLDSTFQITIISTCNLVPEKGGVSGSLGRRAVVEVPLCEDILVSVNREPQDKASSLETLHTRTATVWKDLMSADTETTMPQRLKVSSEDSIQQSLFNIVRKGWEKEGQSLRAPVLIESSAGDSGSYHLMSDESQSMPYTPLLLSTSMSSEYYSSTADESVGGGKEEGEYEEQTPDSDQEIKGMDSPTQQPIDQFEREMKANQRLVRRIEGLEMRVARAAPHDKVQRLTRRVEALEMRMLSEPPSKASSSSSREELNRDSEPSKREEELEKEVVSLRTKVGSLEEQVKTMHREMKTMQEIVKMALMANVSSQHKKQTPEENRAELKSMNTEQIVKLLASLDLQQYKEIFLSETISGEILVECDEEVLEQDLGITNCNHIAKLMTVIHGERSPLALIADDSYVKFKSLSKTFV